MCTVTVLPDGAVPAEAATADPLVFRVVCNRDERRSRAHALPPRRWQAGSRAVLSPLDPEGGGTWIAVTDAALVFVLLNANPGPSAGASAGRVSRGLIIPALTPSATLAEAVARVCALHPRCFAPFRLLIVGEGRIVDIVPLDERIRARARRLTRPLLRTSSSLGDWIVDRPRRRLFRDMFRVGGDAAVQDEYHRHCWPGRGATSVLMSRTDACTVSRTAIEVRRHTVRCVYEPVPSTRRARRVASRLARCRAVC